MYPRTATVSYSSDGSAYELNIDNAERQSGGNVVTGFVVTVSMLVEFIPINFYAMSKKLKLKLPVSQTATKMITIYT